MRIAFLSALSLLSLAACKKTVYQQVNQAYSAIYTIQPADWVASTDPDGTKFFSASLTVNELDNTIDNHGGVEVYLTFDDVSQVSDPIYEALPEVINGVAYGSIHTTGKVTIDLRAADGGDQTEKITAPVAVKVVLIDAADLGN